MQSQKFTQFGIFTVALMLPLFLACIVMIFIFGPDNRFEAILMGILALVFLIFLLLFYKLTIYVDDTHISFSLGIGLIRKKIPYSSIQSCSPVKNSVLYGIGIHLTDHGWLFNVSGRYAIELAFKNSKSKLRIGTNKPDEIAALVNSKTDRREAGSGFEKGGKSGLWIFGVILVVAFCLPIVLVLSGKKEMLPEFSDSGLTIDGMYGIEVNYTDILQADTILSLPRIKTRTNGYAAGKTLKGNFRLFDKEIVRLYIKEGVPPYILLKTGTGRIYLNFSNPQKTREVYRDLKNRITEQ